MLKQSNLIKADRRTLNSYDMLYNQVSRKPFFNQSDWVASANNGSLNAYIDALQKSDKIDYESFKDKYNLDYADSSTRIMALYNETSADRMNNDTKRKRTISNPDGTTTEEEYMASDYEYNLSLIRKQNDYNQQMRQREIAQDIKDSMTAADHIAGAFAGAATSLTGGVLTAVDNMTALLGAAGEAVLAEADPTKKLDKFTNVLASDKYRAFSGVVESLVNFETNFTSIRDIDGNYTNYGKYIGGALTSLGEMLPSMLIGYGVGAAAGALGASASVASTAGTVASQGSFYAGMASANVQDMYKQFEAAGADISSAAILSNAAIKSTLQWGVEKALGKILGGTSLDNMIFGVASKGATAKSLTQAGVKTLFKDVVQEGLEEVFQDTSDFLVDQAYGVYINEFKDVTQISFQSLFDAFVIGGLMSFAGSARNILSTRNVYAGDTKLNKLASWQYGLNLESFAQSLDTIQKAAYHVGPNGEYEMNRYLDKKDMDIVRAAVLESYAAYRMVTSVYESIGEERFKAANDILDKITNKINSGFFYIQTADEYVNTIKSQLKGITEASLKKVAKELQESGVTKVNKSVNVTDNVTGETEIKAKELAKEVSVKDVKITDGNIIKIVDDSIIVSGEKLSQQSIAELLKHTAINKLSDALLNYVSRFKMLDGLKNAYKSYSGLTSFDDNTLSCALLFDKSFFTSTLLTGNKDIYKLLSYFVQLTNDVKVGRAYDAIYKKIIDKSIENWCEALADYCSLHIEAQPDIFLFAVRDKNKRQSLENKIKRYRIARNVYQKVLDSNENLSELDTDQRKWLENKIQQLFNEDLAEKLWTMLNSSNLADRNNAMHTFIKKSSALFEHGYDDVNRLKDISIANRVFNRFLDSLGSNIRVSNLLDTSILTESDRKIIVNDCGEVNNENIISFRQSQFNKFTNGFYVFNFKNGKFSILSNEKYIGGTNLVNGVANVEFNELTGINSIISRNVFNKDMLDDEFKHLYKYLTLNDVIDNPDILNNSTKKDVLEFVKRKYNVSSDIVSPQMTMLYINDFLIKNGFKSLAITDNGDVVVVDLTHMKRMLTGSRITNKSKLTDIIKSQYIPNGLKLEILSDEDFAKRVGSSDYGAAFEPYKLNESINQIVISNTILVPESLYDESQEKIQTVLLHELQHAIQFDNDLDSGADWYPLLSPKDRRYILDDFRHFAPQLTKGLKDKDALKLIRNFGYLSAGDLYAYGAAGNANVYDFVPFRILDDDISVYVLTPWNKKYKLQGVTVDSPIVNNRVSNFWNDNNLDKLSLNDKISDEKIRSLTLKKGEKWIETDRLTDNLKTFIDSDVSIDWLHAPMNSDIAMSEQIKSKLKESITDDIHMDSLRYMNEILSPGLPFEDFMKQELDFIRIQYGSELQESPFVSVYAGLSGPESIVQLLDSYATLAKYPTEIRTNDITLLIGKIKVSDVLFYYGGVQSETLIEPSKVNNLKTYKMDCAFESEFDFDNYTTVIKDVDGNLHFDLYVGYNEDPNEDFPDEYVIFEGEEGAYPIDYIDFSDIRIMNRKFTEDELMTIDSSTIDYNNLTPVNDKILPFVNYSGGIGTTVGWGHGFDLTSNEILTYGIRVSMVNLRSPKTTIINPVIKPNNVDKFKPHKDEITEKEAEKRGFRLVTSKTDKVHFYKVNEDGTQRLTHNNLPVVRKVDKEYKSRYVSKNKFKGTNLEAFNKKYTPLQMSKEMQDFILNAKDLDPILQHRITGSKAGTLTEHDVMDYLRSAETIDNKTFNAINNAFFKNKHIKTFEQLETGMTSLPIAWAYARLIREHSAMRKYESILHTEGFDLNMLVEAIENNKDQSIAKSFSNKQTRYDTFNDRLVISSDEYIRTSFMEMYDGTLQSLWEIAAKTRYPAIHSYEVTHKVELPKDFVEEAYAEIFEVTDVTKPKIIEYLKKKLMAELYEKAKNDGTLDDAEVAHIFYLANELGEEVGAMTMSEIKSKYGGDQGVSKIIAEGIIAETTGKAMTIDDNVPVTTSRELVARIRGYLRTIRANLSGNELNAFVNKHSDIFDKGLKLRREVYQDIVQSKTRSTKYYRNKSVDQVQRLFDTIVELKNEVLENKRMSREAKEIKDTYTRELERRVKEYERRLKDAESGKKNKDIPTVTEFIVENEVIKLRTDVPIPDSLKLFLQQQYEESAPTTVKNLTGDSERHAKMITKNFYDKNALLFNKLTQSDVNEIVDFYLNHSLPMSDVNAPYIATQVWVMTYLIKAGRRGSANFVIDADTLTKLESSLKTLQSTFGTGQVVWRDALHELDPVKIIQQSMKKTVGIKIDEADIDSLLKAVESKDMVKVEDVKSKIYTKYLNKFKTERANRPKLEKALEKILQYERLAMLSGPGTWVRNWVSNYLITGTNKLADGMNGKLDAMLSKLFPKNQIIKDQYKIAGTKVTSEVSEYIAANLLNNGLLDMVTDSLNKYDTRREVTQSQSAEVLTQMIVKSVKSQFYSEHLTNNKYANKVEDFIRKMISDDKSIKKAAVRYLGKMLTEDLEQSENAKLENVKIKEHNERVKAKHKGEPIKYWKNELKPYEHIRIQSKTELFSVNRISEQFMRYVAEAYKMASYDYMHKSNIFTKFESEIARRSTGAYFMYKQVFPFAGASWNWFVEGLNYSPIGLAKAIINFAKLEKTVEKMEESRRTFQYGDIGLSSSFAKYLTLRNVTKGLIGSVGYIIGALLVGFGVARIDEEDDKYKIVIGDQVYIDISDVFGTQGIFLGIATVGAIKDQQSIADVFAAALDQLFIDSTFADVFNNFRYSKSFGDWLSYQPIAMLNMNIPNFLKTITSLTTPYTVKYSDGILGKVERLAVNALPGLSYAFPHYYDPYTGEKQVSQKLWFLTKMVDKLSPLGLSIYNVSELEKMAIKYGVNKTQLTGRYTINDKNVKLSSSYVEKLNMYYGQLNVTDFKEIQSDRVTYKIQQPNGSYKKLRWSQMTEKEKAAIVSRTMTNNSGYAKIYILTESGKYKYYATEAEYKELRSLGITKNVYKATGNKKGFVEN